MVGQKAGCLRQPVQLGAATSSDEASPYLLVAMDGPMEVTRKVHGSGAQSSGWDFIAHIYRAAPWPTAESRPGGASSVVSSEAAPGGYQSDENHMGGFTHTVKPAGAMGVRRC